MTETTGGFLLPSQTSHTRGASNGSSPVGDVAGIKLDQYKRYLFTPPSTPDADEEAWTRVTTVSAFGVNQGGLRVWTERKILGGLTIAPVLRTRLAVADPDDTTELDSILEDAKIRGGVHDAAAEGTARHHELERWVQMGADYPGPPPEVAADVTAAIQCVLNAGLEIVRIENLICIESLRVAGRVDKYVKAPNGKLRALDWKTGKDAVGTPAKRAQFSMQLAPYGNASHVRRPDGTWQLADELNIDHETAYLVHVHDGVAQLYDVPLVDGWRAFQAAYILHRHSSTNGAPTFLPIGRPARFDPVIENLDPMPVSSPSDWDIDPMTQLGRVLTGQMDERIPAGVIACGPNGTVRQLPSEDAAIVQAFAESLSTDEPRCSICNRALGQPGDPDSVDCGGDCAACMREAESAMEPVTPLSDLPVHPAVADLFPGHRVQEPIEPTSSESLSVHGEPLTTQTGEDDRDDVGTVVIHYPELAPLADRSKGERGCGVCGRKGHKRGSPKCLGDADPAKRPSTFSPIKAQETGNGWTDPTPDPFPQPPATPVAYDYCDGHCQVDEHNRPIGLEPERDADRNVTGRYVCKGCGKPATVTAVRAHVSSFSGDARPADEREATRERLVQPATIPTPPAQKRPDPETHKHSWSRQDDGTWACSGCGKTQAAPQAHEPAWLPSDVETYAADIQACASRDHLDQLMTRIGEAGKMTDELKALAVQKWNSLPSSF